MSFYLLQLRKKLVTVSSVPWHFYDFQMLAKQKIEKLSYVSCDIYLLCVLAFCIFYVLLDQCTSKSCFYNFPILFYISYFYYNAYSTIAYLHSILFFIGKVCSMNVLLFDNELGHISAAIFMNVLWTFYCF